MANKSFPLLPVILIVGTCIACPASVVFSVYKNHEGRPHGPKLIASFHEGMTFKEARERIKSGPLGAWDLDVERWSPVKKGVLNIDDDSTYFTGPLGGLDTGFAPGEVESFTGEVTAYDWPLFTGDGEKISFIFQDGKLVKKEWHPTPG